MNALRQLPSVNALLDASFGRTLIERHGRALVLFAVKTVLEEERQTGAVHDDPERWRRVDDAIRRLREPRLQPCINATGVILHTNLGRAPLADAAAAAAAAVARGYSTLEVDLGSGKRGLRHDLVSGMLSHLTGAEAAAVVNNCAAATLLMLSALARGKEVLVSRGELVEIGGAFRMPEIMRLSGARMVEVGTTNRTRVEDYAQAITTRTAAILKVHASNFQVVGFTESADLGSLAALARDRDLLLLHDLGSGALLKTSAYGLAGEPRIQDSIAAGVHLVVCSADKMLGGPQAGLLLGRAALVARTLKHPLARAVRIDKMTLAALAATLDLYLTGAATTLPIWEMIAATPSALAGRSATWQRRLEARGVKCELKPGESTVGGGSLPGERLPTTLLALAAPGARAGRLLERLRGHRPPVIARIDAGRVVLDPRTVLPDQDDEVVEAVLAAVS
ncbi:MAG TPA: L-seryl-tRNA(Sec) selenium transferase [Candidatus Dormibacteraeota bacterium]|jgi:L-seryl-tRNA(Ser) seleniumtransferase